MFFLKKLNQPRLKRYPIVFIPGILGSLGDDIFAGTGELDFGFAEYVYRPIINILNDMGYEENKNLFISYYDWSKRNMESAKNYLIPSIEKAKEITNSSKVDIISHSMGGIVARSYAQSELYNDDINRLIMIGTPNTGAVNAYYFWSGGEFVSDEPHKNVIYRAVRNSYMWYFRNKYKKKLSIENIRNRFPSIEELLPSYKYGDYLIKEDLSGDKSMPIKNMYIKNDILNKLNKNTSILKKRKIRVYSIVGTSIETNKNIKVKKYNKDTLLWQDGKPIEDIKTNLGDGTVICESAAFFKERLIYINSDHIDILKDSKYALASILQTKTARTDKQEKKEAYSKIHNIITTDISHISVEIDSKERLISSHKKLNTSQIISRKLKDGSYWVMIICNSDIEIKLRSREASGEINIYTENLNTKKVENKSVKINGELRVSI